MDSNKACVYVQFYVLYNTDFESDVPMKLLVLTLMILC